jgi:transketolase
LEGAIIGVHDFGASAPGPEVMQRLGFTVENVIAVARGVLERAQLTTR